MGGKVLEGQDALKRLSGGSHCKVIVSLHCGVAEEL